MALELVGVVHPDLRVALGVLRADQDVVAGLGPEVDARVAVRGVVAVVLEIEVRRRRHVVHLVPQRARLHLHRVLDAGHAVDQERMRAGHVHDDRRIDLEAVRQRHPGHAAVIAPDLAHLRAE